MLHRLFILCVLIASGSDALLRADNSDREYFDDNIFKRGKDISLEDYGDDDLEFRNLDLYPENYPTERELDYDGDDDDNDLYAREMEKDQDQDPDSFPIQKRKYCRPCKGRKSARINFASARTESANTARTDTTEFVRLVDTFYHFLKSLCVLSMGTGVDWWSHSLKIRQI